jgi:heme a synthase
MHSFRKLAFVTTVATYFLIYMGGLVRAAGAGLGCPDWPKCFGNWIPPLHVSQLPPDIDPAHFNFVLAWIEYINRLAGVTVGILIIALLIQAIRVHRKVPNILRTCVAILALVIFQGWQGGQVVASELQPLLISVHMVLAVFIVSLLIYVTQTAWYLERPELDRAPTLPGNGYWLVWLLAGTSAVQITLGTQIRSQLEILTELFPLAGVAELLSKIGLLENAHMLLGIALMLASIHVGMRILHEGKQASLLVRQAAFAMMLVIVIQMATGISLAALDMPALARLFHMVLSSLYCGMLVILLTAYQRQRGYAHE